MVSPDAIGTIIGFVIVTIIIGLYKYHQRTGWIPVLSSRERAKEAHDQIPEVYEKLESVEEKLDCVDSTVGSIESKVDDTHTTIAFLHRDELEDDPLVRSRLDVDHDDDILSD